jgi:resuscitation-promoting factor RpfC
MFSIPAAGLAKAAVLVTIPLHPIAANHFPAHYTVRPGDTLSTIARHEYGSADKWPALWWTNRHKVHNPEVIVAGQRLRLSAWHPRRSWLTREALAAAAITGSKPAPGVSETNAAPAPAPDPAPAAQPATQSYGGAAGSFQACVIARESGGNASAVNPSSGAGGLYQFLPSTWQSLGYSGLPQDASVAEQNAAFQKEYAESGGSAWSSFDGC